MALLPRVLEGGRSGERRAAPSCPSSPRGAAPQAPWGGHVHDAHTARWAVEDAWRASLVQQRWSQFARQLDAAQCEALLVKAAARRLVTRTLVSHSDAGATDGWNLATRGYVPHRAQGGAPEMRQAQLC